MSKLLSIVLALSMLITMSSMAFAQDMDVVDTAASNEDFSTLVAAIQAAGLVEALQGEGPFTVFAPVNAAFEPFAEDGTLDALLADPAGDLTNILLYHVVPGKVMSSDLSDGLEAETLSGATISFTITDDGAMVNESNIVTADIETTNGVIHVIDSVLIPPAAEAEGEMAEEAEGDMAEGEMAEGDMAEGDMAEGDMAEGDMAEEAEAAAIVPVELPATGAATSSMPLPLVVAAGLLAVLAVGAVAMRRS